MAVFVDHKLDSGSATTDATAEATTRHELIAWHTKYPLLAVSSYNEYIGGEINFFGHEGGKTKDTPIRKAALRPTEMAWHPDKQVLAVGWSNGDSTIWSREENDTAITAVPNAPAGSIECMAWSSNGLKLLLADVNGDIIVHKIDHRGQPHSTPYAQAEIKEAAKCVCLKPPARGLNFNERNVVSPTDDQEDALDAFASRMRSNKEDGNAPRIAVNESATFFVGGAGGGVHVLKEGGSVQQLFFAERSIVSLLYLADRDILLTLSEDLMLHQHTIAPDCSAQEKIRVKLSGKMPNFQLIVTDPGVLAMCSSENQIRLWDLNTEENCILQLLPSKGYNASDAVTCLAYSQRRGVLSGGTSSGKVATWKRRRGIENVEMAEQWRLQPSIESGGAVLRLEWSSLKQALAISTGTSVSILQEQNMLSHLNDKLAAVQTAKNALTYVWLDNLTTGELKPDLSIQGIYVSEKTLAVWDNAKVTIYELPEGGSAVSVGTFACNATAVALYQQNVYCLEPGKINVRTFQGTIKQVLNLPEIEGDPILLDINGQWLCVGTSNGFLRIYDLSRREARQQFHSKYIVESVDHFAMILSAKVNSAGTRASCECRLTDGTVGSKLLIWDAEADSIGYFDFGSGLSDQQEYDQSSDGIQTDFSFKQTLSNHTPGMHCWDAKDHRFLVCEANFEPPDQGTNYIVTLFVTSEHGVMIQDAQAKSPRADTLIGVDVPFLYFTKKMDVDDENETDLEKTIGRQLIRRVLREFIGLENSDQTTRDAMLNFSFYLTVGNMDEAFKAIKLIKSESVWENMAQMCVKTRRLDVAAVCMGNMGHARGARALRRVIRAETQPEVRVATLAVQLGLTEEARSLYQSCGRYDLLNKVLQSTNGWKQAFEIAQKNDRIHLRNTYFAYAAHLESLGAVESAIESYEKSDTHRFEIPRMLFDDPMVLEQYVKKKKDSYLQKWWAQYLESLGEMEAAKSYYQAAEDYLSVVRICCYIGNIDEAAAVANASGDKAACYHLARKYENDGQVSAAVHFFAKAHAYSSAIRLAKEHNLQDKIAQLSLMAGEGDMIEAAKFYENVHGQADKAVMLYHKAGMFGRALDLAFRTEQFGALDLIAADLNENSDPRVLERCAEFFGQNQQYDKAVQLLAHAKKYKEAVDMCTRRNVAITEELAEALTPSKEAIPNAMDRNKLLERIADCCIQQGNYHMAAKKYTQAGSKTEAMRALLKSGDTEKIVFFANTARSKDIYVMAGNYLQTVNWKDDPNMMKQIETFYNKGGAPDSLAGFYEACAQVEIDDYRDYEKAASALQEALRCLNKATAGETSKNAIQLTEKQDEINKTIALIKRFLNIR
uniref:Anaphase-promoting complex subunit 4-like WD40 domain-containing protein n=1 Tax=Plectus sambesii TaxID=2011161 RepID=A0A914XUQ0_9BILA